MYTTNHRTIRVDESKGLTLLYRGIITRSDLVNVKDGKIIIEDTTFAIVKRIINYIDVEVLTETGWTLVEAGDETSLAVSFENMTVHNKQNKEAIIHEDPIVEPTVEEVTEVKEDESITEELTQEEVIEEPSIEEEVVVEDAEISVNEEPVSEDNTVEEITEESSEEESVDEAEISDSVSVEITMDTDNNKPQQNYNSQKNFNKKKHRH